MPVGTLTPLLPCRFAAGTALHSGVFGEVDEPEEPGSVEGEVDIYRDSPLRYLGARRLVPPHRARPPRRLGLPSAQSAPGGAASVEQRCAEAGPSDSPGPLARPTRALRSCAGYANECGEAFRPLVPVELVYFTYFLAISYVLADTVVRVRGRGRASPGPTPSPRQEGKRVEGCC